MGERKEAGKVKGANKLEIMIIFSYYFFIKMCLSKAVTESLALKHQLLVHSLKNVYVPNLIVVLPCSLQAFCIHLINYRIYTHRVYQVSHIIQAISFHQKILCFTPQFLILWFCLSFSLLQVVYFSIIGCLSIQCLLHCSMIFHCCLKDLLQQKALSVSLGKLSNTWTKTTILLLL